MGKQKPAPVRGVQNDLQTRINQSGGIQAGAHPEFDQPTPLEKVGTAISGAVKAVKKVLHPTDVPTSTQPRRPSTTHERR